MKKIVLLVVVCCLLAVGTAFAGGNANTGCGLGSLLFGEMAQSGQVGKQTLLVQVFESTTNGSFGSQTFGITTGTSNCDKPSTIVKNDAFQFATANLDNLAKDIAMGQGETLATFAELMDIPAAQRTQVYSKLQANFSRIFTAPNVQAGTVMDNIVTIINS